MAGDPPHSFPAAGIDHCLSGYPVAAHQRMIFEPFDADLGQMKMAAWLLFIPRFRTKLILVFIKKRTQGVSDEFHHVIY